MSISQLLPLPAGTFIKDYEIIGLLGKGGFGSVYKAKPRNGSYVAIKETHYTNEQLLETFRDEGELLRTITDEDFPKVHEHFPYGDSRYYLVMDLIEGDDLLDVLAKARKPLELRKVLDWADKILESLISLHSRGIVHRDIKPENLKLTPKGRIKIIDLGIAKGYFGEATQIKYVGSVNAATPRYAPIEQHLRLEEDFILMLMMCSEEKTREVLNQSTDARADIYALGVTLYHLLTNTVPAISPNRALSVWSGKGDLVIPAHQVNKNIPLEISQVLYKAMEIERNNRFVSVTEMREVLNKAIGAVIYRYEQQKIDEQAKREKDLAERERKLREREAKVVEPTPTKDWREIEAERLQKEQEETKRRQKQIDDIQRELRELKAKPKPSGAKWLVGIISAIILFIGGLLGLNLWVKVTAPQVANTSSNKVNTASFANTVSNSVANLANTVTNKPANSATNVAINPVTNAESYFTKGYNCKKDDYNCQILNYTTATNLKEDYAEAYAGLGYAYYKQEKYDKAIKNYNKAIKLKEDFTNAYNELGDVYFDTEKYALAIKNYDKALSLKPDWDFALWNRGHAYWALKKRNEAIKDFRRALEINPDYQSAKDSLKSILAEKVKQ
jgi:serine/threonine protein kinase